MNLTHALYETTTDPGVLASLEADVASDPPA